MSGLFHSMICGLLSRTYSVGSQNPSHDMYSLLVLPKFGMHKVPKGRSRDSICEYRAHYSKSPTGLTQE